MVSGEVGPLVHYPLVVVDQLLWLPPRGGGGRWDLVVSLDLIEGTATRAAGIEDLVQKGQEGEFWGEDTLAVRVIAVQEVGGNPVGAKAFQVMERLLAQVGVDFLEGRVKPAKERSGGKHISGRLQIRA